MTYCTAIVFWLLLQEYLDVQVIKVSSRKARQALNRKVVYRVDVFYRSETAMEEEVKALLKVANAVIAHGVMRS